MSDKKKDAGVAPPDNHMPTPPAAKEEPAAPLDNHMPSEPADGPVTTLDNHMPMPPALDRDGK